MSEKCCEVANSVDPDQTPHSAASDLGLPVCSGLSARIEELRYIISMKRSGVS